MATQASPEAEFGYHVKCYIIEKIKQYVEKTGKNPHLIKLPMTLAIPLLAHLQMESPKDKWTMLRLEEGILGCICAIGGERVCIR